MDWDNVRVLEQQPRLYNRVTLESIHIRSHPHTLNRNDGTLPPVYNSLFNYTYVCNCGQASLLFGIANAIDTNRFENGFETGST